MTHPLPRGPAVRRAHLALVALESREGPSTLTGLGGTDLFGQGPGVPPPGGGPGGGDLNGNRPPVITGFSAIVGPNGRVTFVGMVTDDEPVENMVVTITGGGISVTAVVLRDGSFRVTTTASGDQAITVTATVKDSLGATSNPAQTTFTPT
jgi:hypothetical protein